MRLRTGLDDAEGINLFNSNFRKFGWNVNFESDFEILNSAFNWVLVVEKESFFVSLLSRGFFKYFPDCLLVTAKGYPDYTTKEFLRKIKEKIPRLNFYYMGDFDAYGLDIYLNYCFGSPYTVFEENDLNFMNFLGLDGRRFLEENRNDYEDQILDLEVIDENKICEILELPFMNLEFEECELKCRMENVRELALFLRKSRKKMELEILLYQNRNPCDYILEEVKERVEKLIEDEEFDDFLFGDSSQ